MLLSLLEDCHRRLATLVLPHTGLQRDRFTVATRERNIRFRLYGQPNIRHYCKKCVRFFEDGRKVSAVVIDGVTIGRPCCSIHNCHSPLQNNQHLFCPNHARFNLICAIVGCNMPTAPKSRTCLNLDHQATEKTHHERGQARFQLKERMKRARVAHPNDALALAEDEIQTDGESDSDRENNSARDSDNSNLKPKIKARFSRRRTHNEQVVVAPCGVILSRATFFGAEGVGSVIVCPFFWSLARLFQFVTRSSLNGPFLTVMGSNPTTFFLTTTVRSPKWFRMIHILRTLGLLLMFFTSSRNILKKTYFVRPTVIRDDQGFEKPWGFYPRVWRVGVRVWIL